MINIQVIAFHKEFRLLVEDDKEKTQKELHCYSSFTLNCATTDSNCLAT